MENDISKLVELVVKIYFFDHTYYFSDDYRVWKSGEKEKQELIDKAAAMDLSIGDKLFMITGFQQLWNENCDEDFTSIDENHTYWPYKSSMYEIAGITNRDLLFSPIQ